MYDDAVCRNSGGTSGNVLVGVRADQNTDHLGRWVKKLKSADFPVSRREGGPVDFREVE